MRTVTGLDNLIRPDRPVAMTIGVFDGVHLGHQAIFRRVVELARQHNFLPALMTFEYHPLKFLDPPRTPGLIMPLDERLKIMERFGLELVVIARCSRELFRMERDEFVRNVLIKYFDLRCVVEGPNFRFGCDRTGDIDHLIRIGPGFGFQAVKIDPILVDLDERGTQTVSSSLVRKLITEGRVDLARRCLGRPFRLFGRVVTGARRGATIGFPTANLDVAGQMIPQNGIYAARLHLDDATYPAAAIIGPAPTFEQYQTVVEAHVLDFTGDLYGRRVSLDLHGRIRDIVKFAGTQDLARQIEQDIRDVRRTIEREETR